MDEATRNIDAFLGPSQFTIRKHQERGIHGTMIHLPQFHREPDAAPTDRENVNGRKPYFLFVGRLEKVKGAQVVIPVVRERAEVDLLIAGAGHFEAELRTMASGATNIKFLGQVDPSRLQPLYRNAVATIVPSLCYETFGLVVAESFSASTPVIVNAQGSLAEMVSTYGGGLMYRDTNELAGAIDDLRSDPNLRERLGREGQAAYEAEFTEDVHLAHYLAIVDELLAKKRAREPLTAVTDTLSSLPLGERPVSVGRETQGENDPASPAPVSPSAMPAPQLSIVVASCVGPPFITRCLQSLDKQRGQADVEFIVVDRAGGAVAAGIERDFPWVTLIRRPADESVPDLRRFGIQAARAPHVAIIEEHCVARADWIATLLRCAREPVAATGGVVADAAYARRMDWAVYFTEYNSYMPPGNRGETRDMCVANCVYRRDVLLRYLPAAGSGYWEAGLNHTMLAAGEHFRTEPELVVYHTGPFRFGYYLRQRYLFSRAFAGTRRAHMSAGARVAYLMLAPCLIPLLWARMARRVFAGQRSIGSFILAQPYLLPVLITYVFGEWIGFLAGPGDSLSKIE